MARPLPGPVVAICAVLLATHPLKAQVFQIQGGGSSLFEGYGGLLNIWGNGYEASLGIGYLDGLKLGAAGRRLIGGRDTLRVGNDLLPMNFDTDVFQTGGLVFAQGASLQRRRGRTQTWLFTGASASALSAPYFGSQRAVHAMAWSRAQYDLSREWRFTGHAVATDRQTFMGTARWSPTSELTSSASLGVGSNSPYGALALDATTRRFDARAALIGMGPGFRRASAPMPLQTELERENALLTWKPLEGWTLGAGRQHFRQDSAFHGIPQRATLTQITGTGRLGATALSAGWLLSEAGGHSTASSYLTGRRGLRDWLEADLYLLRVWRPAPSRVTTPVLLLRETVTSRFSLLEAITHDKGRTNMSVGGSISNGLSAVSLDYQVTHSPYLTSNPFVQSMGVNAKLYIRGISLSFGSFVTPDGRIHYSAQGNTFMYRGVDGGAGSSAAARVSGYLASGRVVDEAGMPIDGAALEIGGETIYTDSQGRFFVRKPSTRPVPIRVVLNDFLLPGVFEVVSAPTELYPSRDDRAVPVKVVLRRVIERRNEPNENAVPRP